MAEAKNGHSYGEAPKVDQTWRIRVQLFLRPNDSMYFKLSLRSRVRPTVLSQGEVEVQPGAQNIALATIQRMADEQGANYGDPHNTDELYRQGVEAMRRLFAGWEQQGREWVHACHTAKAYDRPLATVVVHE